jgi:hypothetical protein
MEEWLYAGHGILVIYYDIPKNLSVSAGRSDAYIFDKIVQKCFRNRNLFETAKCTTFCTVF